jgi:hypothetical protein
LFYQESLNEIERNKTGTERAEFSLFGEDKGEIQLIWPKANSDLGGLGGPYVSRENES